MTTRRGLFGMFAGAALLPVVKHVPLPVSSAPPAEVFIGYERLSLSDIVTQTLKSRSMVIADNMTKSNALLDRLSSGAN